MRICDWENGLLHRRHYRDECISSGRSVVINLSWNRVASALSVKAMVLSSYFRSRIRATVGDSWFMLRGESCHHRAIEHASHTFESIFEENRRWVNSIKIHSRHSKWWDLRILRYSESGLQPNRCISLFHTVSWASAQWPFLLKSDACILLSFSFHVLFLLVSIDRVCEKVNDFREDSAIWSERRSKDKLTALWVYRAKWINFWFDNSTFGDS